MGANDTDRIPRDTRDNLDNLQDGAGVLHNVPQASLRHDEVEAGVFSARADVCAAAPAASAQVDGSVVDSLPSFGSLQIFNDEVCQSHPEVLHTAAWEPAMAPAAPSEDESVVSLMSLKEDSTFETEVPKASRQKEPSLQPGILNANSNAFLEAPSVSDKVATKIYDTSQP